MSPEELEELRSDLRAVRKAVDRHSPLLREVAASDFFARLSLPYAAMIILFGVGTHFLLHGGSDYAKLPAWWRPAFWAFLVLVSAVGGILKIRFISKRAAATARPAGFWLVYRSVFGGDWFHMNLASALIFAVVSVFAAGAGRPWYILAAATVWFGFVLNSMGFIVRRREYFAAGWFGVVAGLAALFFLEAAPWLWLALLPGGMLLVFGLVGLIPQGKGSPEEGR